MKSGGAPCSFADAPIYLLRHPSYVTSILERGGDKRGKGGVKGEIKTAKIRHQANVVVEQCMSGSMAACDGIKNAGVAAKRRALCVMIVLISGVNSNPAAYGSKGLEAAA